MARFPTDAPLERVIKAFERLGFRLVRQGKHLAMVREEQMTGMRPPLTIPAHRRLKRLTLRLILTQAAIPRDAFMKVYLGQLRRANLHSGPSSS